jgi:hypothetical protein
MNIACHPMYATSGRWTWLCDNFLIGEGGNERLHKSSQELFELG